MTGPIRVLIVDDDPLVAAALTMMLDRRGRHATWSARPPTAREVARRGRPARARRRAHGHPDARVDGLAATERSARAPDPPEVIVLTTFDADEYVLRALRAGASGFLLKDTPPAEILRAVRARRGRRADALARGHPPADRPRQRHRRGRPPQRRPRAARPAHRARARGRARGRPRASRTRRSAASCS